MGISDHGTASMRVGGDDGELRPLHDTDVYSIERILMMRCGSGGRGGGGRRRSVGRSHLTERICSFVLESHRPHKIVNLLFTITD